VKHTHVRLLREQRGLSQRAFWARLGITQSGGSRYEQGSRVIPKPIELLVQLVYGKDPLRTLRRLREERLTIKQSRKSAARSK
jgi:DNA-binding transcriptional regulator YiaG